MEAISTENTLGFFAQKSYKNGVRTDKFFFCKLTILNFGAEKYKTKIIQYGSKWKIQIGMLQKKISHKIYILLQCVPDNEWLFINHCTC